MAVVESGREGVRRLHPRKRDVGSCPCRPNQCLCATLSNHVGKRCNNPNQREGERVLCIVILVDKGKGEVLSRGRGHEKGSSCLFIVFLLSFGGRRESNLVGLF